jgi:hypothetical protein
LEFCKTAKKEKEKEIYQILIPKREVLGRTNLPAFLSYNMDRIENDASNSSCIVAYVFGAAVTFLPSCYLAIIGGYTYMYRVMGRI